LPVNKKNSNFHQNAILQLLLPGMNRQKYNLKLILATGGHFGDDFGKPKYFAENLANFISAGVQITPLESAQHPQFFLERP
jgi:hypothetical protein